MMQCEICHMTDGPFEVAEIIKKYGKYKHARLKLVCEDCGKKIREERKKENETANVCN